MTALVDLTRLIAGLDRAGTSVMALARGPAAAGALDPRGLVLADEALVPPPLTLRPRLQAVAGEPAGGEEHALAFEKSFKRLPACPEWPAAQILASRVDPSVSS